MRTPSSPAAPRFAALLHDAVTVPGRVHASYTAFYGYSLGNQILAMAQCIDRGIPVGPLATFKRWRELGRTVQKGSKALALCMPVTVKREEAGEKQSVFQRFCFVSRWFVLGQTEGEAIPPVVIPEWDKTAALAMLSIKLVPFAATNGNVGGYAAGRTVAVSELAPLPHRTLFHELAHVVLGHTSEGQAMHDNERTPRNLREVEAECVALLCCEALGVEGAEYCRGYIQSWWTPGQPVPEKSAQKILRTADTILRAGRGETTESHGEPDA
jgi:antirestriction protein ArdC